MSYRGKSHENLMKIIKSKIKQFSENASKPSDVWKPTGEHTIRIVPYKYSQYDGYPFIELYFHYNFNNKTILSPVSFDKPDPIVQAAEKIKNVGDKESYKLASRLYPKLRIYAPIIVRGEEDLGVRFYGMGKSVYEEILKIMDDPDYGIIFDPYTGTDLVVTYQTPSEVGNDFGKISVRAKRNTSKLADSEEKIQYYLNNQKKITEVFKEYSYEELSEMLSEWLNINSNDDDEPHYAEREYINTKEKLDVYLDKNNVSNKNNIVNKASDAFEKLFREK